ncbi:sugar phosphorylase [Lentisphaerota bacterium ZTH]|nr:sugar phosphorylase [Lentisphaerota bacterium]WET07373.1 sugar phosphorylase [Lentisphaerota bacterium ZTH]
MEIKAILEQLYGKEIAGRYSERIEEKATKLLNYESIKSRPAFSEKDSILITYADMVGTQNGTTPLATLTSFIREYAEDIIDTVHILPFFPYSSDDGFSVTDYRSVKPEYGSWKDIELIGKHFNLAFDAVFNHVSVESKWFQGFLNENKKYQEWFESPDDSFDASKVFRPRALPLFHEYDNCRGEKRRVWTTFSEDQVDLNYHSPELLLEMIDIFLLYLAKGARIIRLDAIAFIWKESGTSCLHLPQAHLLVKLFRKIADKVAPGTVILTETNVPHKDNISYFGKNSDEAQMVYQFPLPPLTAHALLRQDAAALTKWAGSLKEPPAGCTFLNFLASHDGIGVRPLSGLVPADELEFLADEALRKEGKVGCKNNPDGSRSPYELNINYFSLIREPGEDMEYSVRKFMLTQAVMLTMPGIPGIYFHSLFGSKNWTEGVTLLGHNRAINREKLDLQRLENTLNAPFTRRDLIYGEYHSLLNLRRHCRAFHPKSGFKVLKLPSSKVFAILRGTAEGYKPLLGIFNFSNDYEIINLAKVKELPCELRELQGGPAINKSHFELKPYQFMWLTCAHQTALKKTGG